MMGASAPTPLGDEHRGSRHQRHHLGPDRCPRQSIRNLVSLAVGCFTVLPSEGMLAELVEKLRMPRIAQKYAISEEDITATVALLRTQGRMVSVPAGEVRQITHDMEDNLVLATGRLGGAEHLVTGDQGLLRLGQYEGMINVSPREFWEILSRQNR
jgi:predicted nucleic acid-binding protein